MGLLNLLFGKTQRNFDITSLNRDLQILNDCAKLIENTIIPEVFFSRYDLYMEKLSILSDAQKARFIKVKGDNLYQKYKEMDTEEKKIEAVNNFIDRMWFDTCLKAEKLKTEKGKENRYSRFYNALQNYEDKMPTSCIQHYKNLKRIDHSEQTKIQTLNQKRNIEKNGFSHYEYIACSNSCSKCKALDGKVFPLSELCPGVNAPPMCEHCRCSISAHTGENEENYQNWLNSF